MITAAERADGSVDASDGGAVGAPDRTVHGGLQPGAIRGRRRTYDLDDARCRQLLESHDMGRVAWSAADGPQLFPVSYLWWDGRILFRTSPYGLLSELVRRTAVVFEVDEIDDVHRRGWSVIVRGRASGIASPDAAHRTAVLGGAGPWGGGDRNLVIAIAPMEVTGREFRPADDGDGH
ncbi:pyridoxamine 5'-phosphate oxidase family protein [Microlunatus aurantiacus]|uniref:Pyridoxamine 5'-phosphate oxidase family protein n=1 Tax=Microlunatus aurantiacus TaxID=446786 RepID=A0ABP7DY34_9ACTN